MRMKHDTIRPGKRKSVNMSLDTSVVAAARDAGINLSQVAEAAIRSATKAEMERRWRDENSDAIEGWHDWYAKHGHPLEKYRLF